MDTIHRILSGQALTPRELRWAGIIVILWILMDVVQFADWAWQKFH
jgi:hypothetical protein